MPSLHADHSSRKTRRLCQPSAVSTYQKLAMSKFLPEAPCGTRLSAGLSLKWARMKMQVCEEVHPRAAMLSGRARSLRALTYSLIRMPWACWILRATSSSQNRIRIWAVSLTTESLKIPSKSQNRKTNRLLVIRKIVRIRRSHSRT